MPQRLGPQGQNRPPPQPHHRRRILPRPGRSPARIPPLLDTGQGCGWRLGVQSTMATEHQLAGQGRSRRLVVVLADTICCRGGHQGFHKVGTHQDPLGLFSSGGGVHHEGGGGDRAASPRSPLSCARLGEPGVGGKGGRGKREMLKSKLSPVGVPLQLPAHRDQQSSKITSIMAPKIDITVRKDPYACVTPSCDLLQG
jgi:hypothetical protein